LVPRNQWQFRVRQFAIDNVEIGSANRACGNAHEQLSPRRFWLWHIAELQRLPRFLEHHCAHLI
jgi:hypothetical protein